jgi:hypothetical protein
VTWTTDVANTNSSVNFGTNPSSLTSHASDDVPVSSTTHSVYVYHGLPNTNIYFEVVSGGETEDNNGAKYLVTSGAALSVPPSGYNIKGTVYKQGGGVAPYVIVYIRLQDANGSGSPGYSQWGSALTASNGTWIYNLAGLRTADASQYFVATYGTDNVRIIWQGGSAGTVGENGDERIYTTPSTFPGTFDMTLDNTPTAVTLAGFRAEVRPLASSVTLDWSTSSEVGVIGFNLYRAEALAGEQKLLNPGLIPARHPGELIGGQYSFEDTHVISGGTYTYWVEIVKQSGPVERSSPQEVWVGYKVFLPTIQRR